MNTLLTESDAVAALPAPDDNRAHALARLQARFTRRVEKAVRAAAVPVTMQGMAQMIVDSLAGLQRSLYGIEDVLRCNVSFFSLLSAEDPLANRRFRPVSPTVTRRMTTMMIGMMMMMVIAMMMTVPLPVLLVVVLVVVLLLVVDSALLRRQIGGTCLGFCVEFLVFL